MTLITANGEEFLDEQTPDMRAHTYDVYERDDHIHVEHEDSFETDIETDGGFVSANELFDCIVDSRLDGLAEASDV